MELHDFWLKKIVRILRSGYSLKGYPIECVLVLRTFAPGLVVVPEAIAVVVITCLNICIVRPTPFKDDAVAMLRATRLERVIRLFIGAVEIV
jgi:hypothetical protein